MFVSCASYHATREHWRSGSLLLDQCHGKSLRTSVTHFSLLHIQAHTSSKALQAVTEGGWRVLLEKQERWGGWRVCWQLPLMLDQWPSGVSVWGFVAQLQCFEDRLLTPSRALGVSTSSSHCFGTSPLPEHSEILAFPCFPCIRALLKAPGHYDLVFSFQNIFQQRWRCDMFSVCKATSMRWWQQTAFLP